MFHLHFAIFSTLFVADLCIAFMCGGSSAHTLRFFVIFGFNDNKLAPDNVSMSRYVF